MAEKKKILITGSNGFLAQNIAKFLNKNFIVYGIGRGKKKNKLFYKKNFNLNINKKNLSKLGLQFNYIIHCAGSALNAESKKNYIDNVETTKALMDFISKKNKKANVIFFSSLAVYGNKSKILNEKLKLNPISLYAKNKISAENIIKKYQNKYKFNAIIIRSGPIFGPGLKKQFIYDTCKKINSNNNIFFSEPFFKRDWLYIDDLTRFIKKIIYSNFKNFLIINLGSQKAYTLLTVINYIKKKFNKKNFKPSFNKKGIQTNPKLLIANISKAKKFNWKPKIKFHEGLDNYIRWFKKNV